MGKYILLLSISLLLLFYGLMSSSGTIGVTGVLEEEEANKMGYEVAKTEDEWKSSLSKEDYHILREKGTEPAFSGKYNSFYEVGVYECKACGNRLFSAKAKFDSGTGWPSFYEPIKEGAVRKIRDRSYGMERVEVVCNRCGSHQGHVFTDGPNPTGLRYCINSKSLSFKKEALIKDKEDSN